MMVGPSIVKRAMQKIKNLIGYSLTMTIDDQSLDHQGISFMDKGMIVNHHRQQAIGHSHEKKFTLLPVPKLNSKQQQQQQQP